jgi:hypothetical protein
MFKINSLLILLISTYIHGTNSNSVNIRGLTSSKCCLNEVCVDKDEWTNLLDNVVKCQCKYDHYTKKYSWNNCYCLSNTTEKTTTPKWTTETTTTPTWTTEKTTKPTWTADYTTTYSSSSCCWQGNCVNENEWLDDDSLKCQCVYIDGEYKWKNCKDCC